MASTMVSSLVDVIRGHVPGFKLGYKNESLFMRLLAVLSYPFNQKFMDGYITTIGTTVYFPSRDALDARGDRAASTLAHEFVHMWDSKRQWVRYNLGYISPQIFFIPLLAAYAVVGSWIPVAAVVGAISGAYLALWVMMKMTRSKKTGDKSRDDARMMRNRKVRLAVFYSLFVVALGGYAVLAAILSGWWALLAAGAFVPLAPWPSPWRAKWEYRGYGMSAAWEIWVYGKISDKRLESIARRFTGMDYFRMDPNKGRVSRLVSEMRVATDDGDVLVGDDAKPYRVMHNYLSSGGLLHGNQ